MQMPWEFVHFLYLRSYFFHLFIHRLTCRGLFLQIGCLLTCPKVNIMVNGQGWDSNLDHQFRIPLHWPLHQKTLVLELPPSSNYLQRRSLRWTLKQCCRIRVFIELTSIWRSKLLPESKSTQKLSIHELSDVVFDRDISTIDLLIVLDVRWTLN